ncbi:hypothetical protein [Streptomyces sp. NPDC087297]|uniref:hypothetical protein n=1 Tax=Streptomyces sp. NPDC087297 TaxID=3365778 RepID=UPI00382C721B
MRVVALLLALSAPAVSSCAALENAGAGYPKAVLADRDSLVRSWGAGGSEVVLKAGGSFESKGVDFGTQDCRAGVPDPGAGTWSSIDTGQGATRIQLKFGTGCFGSLWVGTIDGVTVLWRETSPEKHEFASLQ